VWTLNKFEIVAEESKNRKKGIKGSTSNQMHCSTHKVKAKTTHKDSQLLHQLPFKPCLKKQHHLSQTMPRTPQS